MNRMSVLNYNENCVYVKTEPQKSVKIEASENGEPSVIPLTLDEIKFVNNSSAFKTGNLEFPEDIEDELYETLRIDKSKVLKLSEIKDIILNPTKDGLNKILSITSLSDFDRVRGQFQKLKNDGYKLTLDVADLIERRTKELFDNKIKSNLIIESVTPVAQNEERIKELEQQIEEMKALCASVLNSTKSETVDIAQETTEKTAKEPVKKSPGRPSTKKTS